MYYTTGNEVVDRVSTMNFCGNVIPHTWYKTVVKQTGKAYLLAINILADIVYWYRPEEIRNEATGQLVGYKKRFKADALQRSYAQLAELFGCSEGQATDAVKFLESIGVIKRDLRVVNMGNGIKMGNVMYLLLNAQKLYELTYPEGEENSEGKSKKKVNPDSYPENSGEGKEKKTEPCPENSGDSVSKNPDTYTKNTYTENTTKNTTEINSALYPSVYPSIIGGASSVENMRERRMDIPSLQKEMESGEKDYSKIMQMTSYEVFKDEVIREKLSMYEAKKRAEEYLYLHFEREYYKENMPTVLKNMDMVVSYIADIVSTGKRVKLSDVTYDADILGEAYFKLSWMDVEGVLSRYKEAAATHKIANKRSYLLTMLLHAKSDMEMQVNTWIADM